MNQDNRDNWVKEKLALLSGTILDIGAGNAPYKASCTHLTYTGHDSPAPYFAGGNGEGMQNPDWQTAPDIQSDICWLPLTDESFDNVLCTEVLEHVPEPVRALKEMARVLKHHGKLIITAPFCSLVHQAPFYFYSGFSRYWYEKFIPEAGLEIVEIVPNGNFFDYLAQEISRSPEIASRYADTLDWSREFAGFKTDSLREVFENIGKACSRSSEVLCFGYHILAKKIYSGESLYTDHRFWGKI